MFLAASPTIGEEKAAAPGVAAIVGDRIVTTAELDRRLANRLASIRNQEYVLRRQALEEVIREQLIEGEAKRRGIPAADLLRAEVEGKLGLESSTTKPNAAEKRRAAFVEELRRSASISIKMILEPPRVAVGDGGSPSRGRTDAAVTIVEFSDFECPYCARVEPTLTRLRERYGEDVRFVFRDFPLAMHPGAAKAAEASHCAGEQNKFWEMHEKLFANQRRLDIANLKLFANDLTLDRTKFDQCLESGRYSDVVTKSADAGAAVGVTGTPAFFINGRFLSGARPFEDFAQVIDDELQRAGQGKGVQ